MTRTPATLRPLSCHSRTESASSRHRPTVRRATHFLAATILAALTVTGCKKTEETPTPEVTVQAEKVASTDLTEYIHGDTVLSPRAQAAIIPKITAPVKTFLVQRGAHVAAGQLLAVLENRDLAAAVQDNRGALTQADATYQTTTRATVPEDLKKAQTDLAQARANLGVAQATATARASLFAQGAIPKRDLDTANASLVQAQSAFDVAQQHLDGLHSVSQEAAIKSAQGALESAKGKYAGAAADLAFSEIRSPIAGVVTDRPIFAGEMPASGQPVVTVMDTSFMVAKLHLSQEQVTHIKLGADALAKTAGMDEPTHGKVTLISPAVDPGTTTIEVWVTIPNKDGSLKAGGSVHIAIASQTLSNILTVPNEAIIATKSGSPAVMVIGPDSIAHQKAIKTGITDGKDTQVLSGVKAGDQVVTGGAYGMDDGTKVKIGPADDDDAKPAAGKPDDDDDKKPAAGKAKGDD